MIINWSPVKRRWRNQNLSPKYFRILCQTRRMWLINFETLRLVVIFKVWNVNWLSEIRFRLVCVYYINFFIKIQNIKVWVRYLKNNSKYPGGDILSDVRLSPYDDMSFSFYSTSIITEIASEGCVVEHLRWLFFGHFSFEAGSKASKYYEFLSKCVGKNCFQQWLLPIRDRASNRRKC